MRLSLAVRNVDAVVANLKRLDATAIAGVKNTVDKFGTAVLGRSQELCAVDTGFMVDHERLVFTPQGYGFEVGWDAEDFTGAGLAFYAPFVIFGTSKMAAQDNLTPAYAEFAPKFVDDLAGVLKAAVA